MGPAGVPSRYHQSLRGQLYLQRNFRSHKRRQTDDAFSIGTGLELAGIARPVRCLWTSGSSAKSRTKKDRRGLARCLSDA